MQAQNLEFGGLTYNNDLMMSTDFAALSRSHPFGTARVMGMGGAFTSLGADLSSMSINPAGLGMYRRNEFSLTPLLSVAHGQTQGAPSWVGDNKTRFAFANVGVALNVFESPASPLTSLTLGIGMNRIADFMYFLMLTIAYEGELADVDAFDQPGVEVYKKLMKAQL